MHEQERELVSLLTKQCSSLEDVHSLLKRTTMTKLGTAERMKTKSDYATLKKQEQDRGTVWRQLRG